MTIYTTIGPGLSSSIGVPIGSTLKLSGLGSAQMVPPGIPGAPKTLRTNAGGELSFGPYQIATTILAVAASTGDGMRYYVMAAGDAIAPAAGQSAAGPISADAVQAMVAGAGNPMDGVTGRYLRRSMFTPIKVAAYGDSRANIGASLLATSDGGYSGEKMATQLAMMRGDMLLVFNGGSSGDTAANWNSATRISANQAVTDCIATTPDMVLIQYGINDCIAGTAAATIYANLQALVNELLGAGIFVVFESVYTCAPGPNSFVNGYSSAGGFSSTTTPAEYTARLAIMQSLNSLMQTWLAGFPGRAIYVETNAALAGSDGYARADGTWYDGTHLTAAGVRQAAALVNAAIAPYFGVGLLGKPLKPVSRNGLNDACITVSSGRASGYSAGATEAGSLAYSYQVVQDADGEWCQEYTITNTTAAATAGRARLELVPSFIGAATYPVVAATDKMQASIDCYIDDGAGGAPAVHTVYARARIYYNDASNEYAQSGAVAQLASTNYPNFTQATRLKFALPQRAIKAAMSNSTIITNTVLAVYVCMNNPGTVRVRLRRATWGKVG